MDSLKETKEHLDYRNSVRTQDKCRSYYLRIHTMQVYMDKSRRHKKMSVRLCNGTAKFLESDFELHVEVQKIREMVKNKYMGHTQK